MTHTRFFSKLTVIEMIQEDNNSEAMKAERRKSFGHEGRPKAILPPLTQDDFKRADQCLSSIREPRQEVEVKPSGCRCM